MRSIASIFRNDANEANVICANSIIIVYAVGHLSVIERRTATDIIISAILKQYAF